MSYRLRRGVTLTLLVMLATGTSACTPDDAQKPSIQVFVAASLADVVQDLANRFECDHNVAVRINAAATGVVRKQIELGAKCDVFIGAGTWDMDRLASMELVDPNSRRIVAHNQLVIMIRGSDKTTWNSLAPLRKPTLPRIAIGDPAYVPAGRFAKAALESLSLWNALQSKLVLGDSVRVVCQYVRLGQADAGFVYASDASRTDGCHVAYVFENPQLGVVYPAAICRGSSRPTMAHAFVDYVAADSQIEVWNSHGFVGRPPD